MVTQPTPHFGSSLPPAEGGPAERDFEAFFVAARSRVLPALRALTSYEDANDAFSDAMSVCHSKWDRVSRMENPHGYAYMVGRRRARRKRRDWDPLTGSEVARAVDPGSFDMELVRGLRQLTARQRTVVLLIDALGWSAEDVAEVLNIGRSSVQTHSARGRARLRQVLGDQREQR